MSVLHPPGPLSQKLEHFTYKVTEWAGSARAFITAVIVVLTWAVTGPLFHYSDTWQLVINTGTTIVTFLMVFLIQRSQNKESLAVQVKLNEIIAALKGASNRLINIESLSEEEVRQLHQRYQRLAELATQDPRHCRASRSIEDSVVEEEVAAPAPAAVYNSPSQGGRTGA
jgi:low affinity Fe/Cu permease